MTEVRLRPQAEADLIERAHHYLDQAGQPLATQFFDAADAALDTIAQRPATGTLRYGDMCDIPGLRARCIDRFPCGWFYFVRSDHVDVVRLLAYTQDLQSILGDPPRD